MPHRADPRFGSLAILLTFAAAANAAPPPHADTIDGFRAVVQRLLLALACLHVPAIALAALLNGSDAIPPTAIAVALVLAAALASGGPRPSCA